MSEDLGTAPTLGKIVRTWWQALPATVKRRKGAWCCLGLLGWLSGAYPAYTTVAGIGRFSVGGRALLSLSMGGFGWIWAALEHRGFITETAEHPHLLWIPLAFVVPASLYGLVHLLGQAATPQMYLRLRQQQVDHAQGRINPTQLIDQLTIERGVPFVQIPTQRNQLVRVGLDQDSGEGHMLVTAATRGGKGLHLTETLLTWHGAAVVIDPKGEQFERTAMLRRQMGPIYRLPGHSFQLGAAYKQLLDRDEVAELHAHWLRPWESRESIFAQKALSLFTAAGLFAQARQLDPIRVLLDLAESDPTTALRALEEVEDAKRHVRVFTNGAKPDEYREDKFVTSAFGNFTTRLLPYQKHIDTVAPVCSQNTIPSDWVNDRSTIYITYSLQELQGAGGVVASIVAALLRQHMRPQPAQRTQPTQPTQRAQNHQRLLVAIDELPALGLKNVSDYLATTGGYGVTMLLYIQAISQLNALYGRDGTQAILANCAHQLWYPPADMETAQAMSTLYGVTLQPMPSYSASTTSRTWFGQGQQPSNQTNRHQGASWSWQEKPVLHANQLLALPKDQVLVSTLADRRYLFLGQRLNPVSIFDQLPSAQELQLPASYQPTASPRLYGAWTVGQATAPSSAHTSPSDASARHAPVPLKQQPAVDDNPSQHLL